MNNSIFLKFVFDRNHDVGTPGITLYDEKGLIDYNRIIDIPYDDFKADIPVTKMLFNGYANDSFSCRYWRSGKNNVTFIIELDVTNINKLCKIGLAQWANTYWTNASLDLYWSKDNIDYQYVTTVGVTPSTPCLEFEYSNFELLIHSPISKTIKYKVSEIILNNELFQKYCISYEEK